MIPDEPQIDRIDELLADRALQGLTLDEQAELERLFGDPEAEGLPLELAAAQAELALGRLDRYELPDSLRHRLEDLSESFRETARASHVSRLAANRIMPWLGWVAAAASLLFAIVSRPTTRNDSQSRPEPTIVERLASVVPRPLANTGHPLGRGGSGSLVWSGARQEGYLKIQGLAENLPSEGVYQLWIFDETRDERFPVDGGTFTIEEAKRTTLIPIRPPLEIRRPTLFAVTLEPAGGVVVSDRKRILLTAEISP